MAARKSKAKPDNSGSASPRELLAGDVHTMASHGVSRETIHALERRLGLKMPKSLSDVLQWRDGGLFAKKRFILFSAGEGVHPDETLTSANANTDADYPLLNIGRDASHFFGFLKDDLRKTNPPVYAYIYEERLVEEISSDLAGWLLWAQQQAGATK